MTTSNNGQPVQAPHRVPTAAHGAGICACAPPLTHGPDSAAQAHGCRCRTCDIRTTVLALEYAEYSRQEGRGDVKSGLCLASSGALAAGYLGLGGVLLANLDRVGWWGLLVALPLALALLMVSLAFHHALVQVRPIQRPDQPYFGREGRDDELDRIDPATWYRQRLDDLGTLLDVKFTALHNAATMNAGSLLPAGASVLALVILLWPTT